MPLEVGVCANEGGESCLYLSATVDTGGPPAGIPTQGAFKERK